MKIIFMGTPAFGASVLESLLQSEHEVVACYTQPDTRKGRDKELSFSPVKECAVRYQIPVYQPVKIRRKEEVEILRSLEADVIVVAAFGQILPKSILDMKRFGCINVHGSILPKYRGAAPVQWSILNGESETGITIMQMNEGLDTGDILSVDTVPILDTDTSETLFDKLTAISGPLLLSTLEKLSHGEIERIPQPEESPTPYAGMFTKEMGEMDFSRSSTVLDRTIRAFTPWPGTYSFYRGRKLLILEAKSVSPDRVADFMPATPSAPQNGEIVHVTKTSFLVQCKEGLLEVFRVKPEGKKAMSVRDFMNGCPIRAGEKLGER